MTLSQADSVVITPQNGLSLLRPGGEWSSIQCRCPSCLTTFDSLRASGAEATLTLPESNLLNDNLDRN